MAEPGEGDFVIVCGDFGLLWAKSSELDYNLDWMSRLPLVRQPYPIHYDKKNIQAVLTFP